MLDRQPALDSEDLRARIQRATVGIDLTVAPSEVVLGSLTASQATGGSEFRALFPREVHFSLLNTRPAATLAEGTVTDGVATAALAGTLDRPSALQLLEALQGHVCTLTAAATARYRTEAGATGPLRLALDLLALHRFLAVAGGPQAYFYEAELRDHLQSLVDRGIVRVVLPASAGDPPDLSDASLESFLRASSFVLERAPDDERLEELGRRYRLGSPPSGSFEIQFETQKESLAGGMASVATESSLQDLFRHALAGQDLEPLVHWVVIDEEAGTLQPLARRVHREPERDARGRRSDAVALTSSGNRITTLSAALRPGATPTVPTHSTLAVQPALLRPELLDHLTLSIAPSERPRHLPVIERGEDPPWPDRVDPDRYWYASDYVAVVPDATQGSDRSPFLFSFVTQGHDMQGRAGLEATVRMTLRRQVPDAVRAALERREGARAEPVPEKHLSVELRIPFRDEAGRTRIDRSIATSAEIRGDEVVATFRFLDDWARVAYGALAYPGFQARSAQVSVAFVFEAYVPVRNDLRFELWHGGKKVGLPVRSDRGRDPGTAEPHVDARDGSIRLPGGRLDLVPEPRSARRPATPAVLSAAALRPTTLAGAAIRPQVVALPELVNAVESKGYAVARRFRRTETDVLFPCSTTGALYVEMKEGEPHPIGCQEAFRLGQTADVLYEKIDLPVSIAGCSVYRSLRTPGRFLVLPARHAITRYEPDDPERAYRPAILLFSTIDVDDLRASPCVIMATLQPDLPRFTRARLLEHLRDEHHPEATLEYATELSADVGLDWALPMGAEGVLRLEAEATRTAEGFEVSLATDAKGLPQIAAILGSNGISGSATFTLPDGTELPSTELRLDLKEVTGPWRAGPLEATVNRGGGASVSNRIESTLNVSELLLLDDDGRIRGTVPAELRLEAGRGGTVDLDDTPARIVPVYTQESSSASLEEIRSFIEDITVAITFVNRLDLAARSLERVRIDAGIPGVPGRRDVAFKDGSDVVQSVEILLPLTSYLADPALELRPTLTYTDGRTIQPDPIPWRLGSGAIVYITAELLGVT